MTSTTSRSAYANSFLSLTASSSPMVQSPCKTTPTLQACGFLAFEESLLQASEAVDVEAVAALMNGSDVPGLRRKHALSFDGVLRYAVSIACRLGSMERLTVRRE